jgi:heptosyltransferase-2
VVANDTGLLHLAAAAGRPVVALFGSTHPALGFAPAGEGHAVLCAGLDCQPCTLHGLDACPRGHHRCMRELAPAAVLEALEARLGGFPGHLPG